MKMKISILVLMMTFVGIFFLWTSRKPIQHPSQRTPAEADQQQTLPVSQGTFTIINAWENDDTNGGEDVLKGDLSFAAKGMALKCPETSFVQVARMQKEDGSDVQQENGETSRDQLRFQGFYVDHRINNHCQKGKSCSAYYQDSWSDNGINHSGNSERPATLVDYPFGWTQFEQIQLEACVVCRPTQAVLGCVKWGGRWPATGTREIFVPTAADQPSEVFKGALATFQKYYGCDKLSLCH